MMQNDMAARQLSRELRLGESGDLTRRRWVIGLSLVGVAAAKAVALYQSGIIRSLPDPPLEVFDSDRVDAAPYAYRRLATPDGFLMLTSYAVTAWLAAAGGIDRSRRNPLVPVAMGAKTLWDVLTTLRLTREEWRDNKALCAYCQAATVASLASAVLAMPETARALQALGGGRGSATHRLTEVAR